MEIVQVERYSLAYPGATEPVLHDVSLHVEEGAFCVVVGATGCGKTTLLKSLKPELAPVGRCSGSVKVCGAVLVGESAAQAEGGAQVESGVHAANGLRAAGGASPLFGDVPQVEDARAAADKTVRVEDAAQVGMTAQESAYQVGFVMQDPAAQIVCDTVWHELAFGLENLGVPQDAMRRRVAEIAHFFGIGPWVGASTESLSGGQMQLVNLAAVFALRPRLLVLDEPTAQLDPHAAEQFLFMLARVNRELGVTVVMSTHAPESMEPYATQWVRLGPMGKAAAREEAAAVLAPRLDARRTALAAANAAIVVRNVHFRYNRSAPWVLRGVDLRVRRGSVHALVGGNGCGKSTLLRLMAGVNTPQRGKVSNALRASQALLAQDPKALFVCDSVAEELREWQRRCGYAESDIAAMLRRFGLEGQAAQHPFDLSGGQQQKLAFAKVLLTKPDLLLLDEPTKGLDPASCASVARIVRDVADEGATVVLVTHDLDFAFIAADEVTMLFDGQVAATEGVREFFENNLVYRPNAHSRLFGQVAHG